MALNPYYDSLERLYDAGKITAAQVHAAVQKTGWNITYADFYAIASPKEPAAALDLLKADVAGGKITTENYQTITGTAYSA